MHTLRFTIRRPARRGFSLMEVLVAIGIFALGFAAIAAIFPTGALLQQRTADDVRGRHAARNAEMVIRSTPLYEDELIRVYFDDDAPPYNTPYTGTDVRPFYRPADTPTPGNSEITLNDFWSLDTRSEPQAIAQPLTLSGNQHYRRDFYWVPLLRDTNPGDQATDQEWEMFIFVMRRRGEHTYTNNNSTQSPGAATVKAYPDWASDDPNDVPGVKKLAVDSVINNDTTFDLAAGVEITAGLNDQLVTSNGKIYQVASPVTASNEVTIRRGPIINPTEVTEIWFAPPADGESESPAMNVLRLPITGTLP